MKKKVFLCAASLAACLCANAQSVKEISGEWSVVPKMFSFTGKPVLVTENHKSKVVSIYDDDLNVARTFNVQAQECTERYETQQLNTLTGEWETINTQESSDYGSIYELDFEDYDNNTYPDQPFSVTQTLFNNDEKFEYVVPVCKASDEIQNEYDSDGDGVVDHRTLIHRWDTNGFKVVNEDGQTVLELDDKFGGELKIMKLNGNLYLTTSEGYFYKIDSKTSSVEKVSSVPASVSVKARYSLDGRRLSRPERGVNVLLREDGTTTKQIVK